MDSDLSVEDFINKKKKHFRWIVEQKGHFSKPQTKLAFL